MYDFLLVIDGGVTKIRLVSPDAVNGGVIFFYLFSERELMFMFAICRRPSVCLSSVVCRL